MGKEIKFKFSKRIKELRKKCGYTQEQVADLSGVEYKHIQLLESKNPSDPKLSTVEKLAKAFGISISKLLNFK